MKPNILIKYAGDERFQKPATNEVLEYHSGFMGVTSIMQIDYRMKEILTYEEFRDYDKKCVTLLNIALNDPDINP